MISITQKEFDRLSEFIKSNYGINLTKKKKTLVVNRLQNYLVENNYSNFSEFLNYMLSDKSKKSIISLINKITTNHTYFMRESDHFDYFSGTVLPYLSSVVKDRDLRVWCAGCSTGEEAYTLAMIMEDYFTSSVKPWDKKLLATDISNQVLKTAMEGIYLKERLTPLLPRWKTNYFENYNIQNSKIVERIQNEIIFRKFNLMAENFPFKRKFHTIFCRNVMIYFDTQTKNKLIEKFYNSLEVGGYLFIGHSESLDKSTTKFNYIKPSIYKK